MKSLHIFDLDDTLINTTAKIKIRNKRGRVVAELGTVEHNNRGSFDDLLGKGMTIDYSEFESLDQLKKEEKLPHFLIFENYLKKYDVYISTARQNNQIIKQWVLDETGIEMDNSHVHSCDFDNFETTAQDKAEFLRKLLDSGEYDQVSVYEDDKNNLKAYKKILKEYKGVTSFIFDTRLRK